MIFFLHFNAPDPPKSKVQTLGNGLLYQVERSKPRLLLAAEKRKALWLGSAIGVCVGITITILRIYL